MIDLYAIVLMMVYGVACEIVLRLFYFRIQNRPNKLFLILCVITFPYKKMLIVNYSKRGQYFLFNN